ncbi:hypothetical protein J3R30DRAFT_3696173 [Lentinula aciculospora]|uniref:Proteophosphoglycan ppg4 n=1 Tax=Lentinula aciculospora TaxID=153920 RepID=A0A9W9AS09_9AGAR|nr:hypothetical protein J3R30DRAFT_3696173 [Lentinula aciculospora]
MFCVSSSPHHDLRAGLYNTLILISFPSPLWILAFFNIFSRLDSVSAAPAITAQLQQRDDQSTNSSTSFRIWVPILVVVVVLAIITLYVWSIRANSGGAIPRALSNFSRAAAIGTGAMMPTTTELTADQLTGNTSTTSANDTNNAANNRTRRPRRNRRTPSQISTISLPVYMKEPGEQELVIIRGPRDMEDVPLETEMPSLREDGDQERYSPIPDSPQHMPLLDGDDGAAVDDSVAALLPEAHEEARSRSDETGRRHSGGSVHTGDSSSLVRVETNDIPDPRGDAPAYFEVVDLNDENQQRLATPPIPSPEPPQRDSSMTAASSSTASRGTSSRRSLRNLFGWSNHRSPIAPPGLPSTNPAQPHSRADSGGALSLTSTMSRPSTSNRHSHRPSQSTSSAFSVVNPLHRKKSTATLSSNHLTSPSSISLASISAPLTHTVVRTEFSYPKTGPTPEQLKLISSREAFARFGVPYGKDAIAFAASTQDLNPPPEFESSAGPSSRPRSQSQVVVARESLGQSSETSGESSGTNGSSALETPEIRVHESSRPASPSVEPDTRATTVESSSPTQNEPNVSDATEFTLVNEFSMSIKDAVTSTEAPETLNKTQTPYKDDVVSPSASSASVNQHVPISSTSVPTSSSKPPPTSFRNPPVSEAPSAPSIRSESRASSFRSFATAKESVNEFGVVSGGSGLKSGSGSGTPTMSDSEYFSEQETEIGNGESRPATPMIPTAQTTAVIPQPAHFTEGRDSIPHHVLEGTDTTIRAAA